MAAVEYYAGTSRIVQGFRSRGFLAPLVSKIFLILFSEIKTEPLLHLILLG